jgi:two-component system chemotaxis response regulator CheB
MKPSPRIRVLVIDDSAFSRRTIIRMLERSPLIEVADFAHDGQDALAKALEHAYDLITLDLEMPRMDGFTFLRILMARRPTPVIVVSGRAGDQDVFRALELGAVDFLAKPTPRAAPELATIEQELIRKVHAVRELRLDRLRGQAGGAPAPSAEPSPELRAHRVVAIGSSTGGPAALMQLFAGFRTAPPCAFVVSQHMPEGFTRGFAARLAATTVFAAREAEDLACPEPGTILVAPGGAHLEFEARAGGVVARVTPRDAGERHAPSVDRMFVSAAKHWGSDLLAVVLTGMGDDGARGAAAVKRAGGNVIVESAETAVIFGMPQQAIRAGAVDAVVPLHGMAQLIQSGFAADEAGPPRGGR